MVTDGEFTLTHWAAVGGLEVRWGGLHTQCRNEVPFLLELLAGVEAPQSQGEGAVSR